MAEEKAAELDNKVRCRRRDPPPATSRWRRSTPTANRYQRVKNAAACAWNFVLTANELATPGEKTIYVRITSPDGYVLTTEAMPTFDFEGERLSYSAMREVDYQNQDLDVGIFYNSTGFAAGTYTVQLFLRRPPDRHLANRHALTAAPGPAIRRPPAATRTNI